MKASILADAMSDNNKRRRQFLQTVGLMGVVGMAGCAGDTGDEEVADDDVPEWTFGTAAEGSSSFVIGSTFSEYLRENDILTDTVLLDPVVTAGTGATYRMLDADEVDIGGTNAALIEDSPDGELFFDEEQLTDFENIRQLRTYMNLQAHGMIHTGDGYETWEDLEGETIAVGAPGAGTNPVAELMIDIGVGMENIQPEYMDWTEMPPAMREGRVAAAFTWATNGISPTGHGQEIDTTTEWAPLPVTDEMVNAVESDLPFATHDVLDGSEIYDNYGGDLDIFNLGYMWIAKADQDPDLIYEIVRAADEQGSELVEREDMMALYTGDPDDYLPTLHPDMPVHEGAYEYYQDQGVWDDYDLTEPPEAQ